ncbi:hypothetical protein HMPREF3213_01946 [Heyndrickxia coagulans]|uniref:Uncharacterized protein n=1 Tax=Heyndrickxia coagulans TaxID=1398 RepID=A0A133KPK3_HEYCO|nr:hypothetical protein HMPREF3213_01946 [Heyndrickxia coagulans]
MPEYIGFLFSLSCTKSRIRPALCQQCAGACFLYTSSTITP